MKKQDYYLIGIALILALLVFFGYRFVNRSHGQEVVVYVGEEEIARFPLLQKTEYEIMPKEGAYNQLVILDGKVDVTDASCPDKVCVHQETISETGETIVCMPNKVIVTIE